MQNLYVKLREGRERLEMDKTKDLRYKSGMMGPS
jgi:hypothetical protein